MQNEFFGRVKDPRVLGKVKHSLEDVLRIVLLGVVCSCDDYDEMHDFVKDEQEELINAGFLKLENGVPSADTLKRVVENINPTHMKASLDCCRDHVKESLSGLHVIIDGKKLRGENPTSLGCDGLYILNAWIADNHICAGELKVEDKTNELKMLPAILASLCLVGALVSIDAMGTHRNIAQQILLQGGNYLMPLKANQPIMLELIRMVTALAKPLSSHTTEEKGHGRKEKRTYIVFDTKLLEQEGMYEEWPGLRRIILVEREREISNVKTKETIFFLSSEEKDAEYYSGPIRNHWGIENHLHWHLDVTLKEDACRVRTKNGAENLSTIRKFALELLKKMDDKMSLKRRRKKCMRNIDYLAEVFKKS